MNQDFGYKHLVGLAWLFLLITEVLTVTKLICDSVDKRKARKV